MALVAVISVLLLVIRPGDDGNGQATPVSTSSSTQQSVSDGTETTQPALLTTSEPASSPEPEATTLREESAEFDLVELRRQLLELINVDRVAAGLQPLEIDAVAETAAQGHADEMAALGYLSHWNVDGFGPDWRYSRSGGRDAVRENISGASLQDRAGSDEKPIDWAGIVADVHWQLMEDQQSKDNILRPEHTHVGIGISYHPTTGARVVQEYISRHVNLAPVPIRIRPGDRLVFRGELLSGVDNPRAEIFFEPFPAPMSLDQLNSGSEYSSPSNQIASIPLVADQNGGFQGEVTSTDASGLYHLRILVDSASLMAIRAVDIVVEAR